MRFGCCGSMIDRTRDPVGASIIESAATLGFDYIELSLADIAALPEEEYKRLVQRSRQSRIRCEACNNFFSARMRLTGEKACHKEALDYAAAALDRAVTLGAEIVVFGSSGAKNIPQGYPIESAWRQIANLLRQLGPLAQARGITLVVEPISRPESNIINLASEGLRMVREVEHPAVQLLVDYYHLRTESEDPKILLDAGGALRHLHFAQVQERTFPKQPEADWTLFFENLRQIGYAGRCSIEAYTQDFVGDAGHALCLLRAASAGLG